MLKFLDTNEIRGEIRPTLPDSDLVRWLKKTAVIEEMGWFAGNFPDIQVAPEVRLPAKLAHAVRDFPYRFILTWTGPSAGYQVLLFVDQWGVKAAYGQMMDLLAEAWRREPPRPGRPMIPNPKPRTVQQRRYRASRRMR